MAQQAVTHNGNTLYLPSWDSQVKGSTKDGDDHMHEVKELFLKIKQKEGNFHLRTWRNPLLQRGAHADGVAAPACA